MNSASSHSRRRWAFVGALLVLGFLVVMVVWPLVAVLRRSLVDVGPGRVVELLGSAAISDVLAFTVWQAVLSVFFTLMVGLPIAHVLARYRFRGRRVIRALVVVPFVLPTVVVATAFDALFRRLGFDFDRSLAAILAAHTFFNVAVVVRVIGGFWARLDHDQLAAARVLGASPSRAFREITLRQLAPVVAAASVLVFLFSFTSYGVILILGGVELATIETEIRRYAIFRQEFDVAAVLAMIQVAVVTLMSWVSAVLQRSRPATVRRPNAGLAVDSWRRRTHVGSVLGLAVVAIGLPLAALVDRSLRVGGGRTPLRYGLDNYAALADRASVLPVSPAQALATSLLFALAAATLASILGVAGGLAVAAGGRLGRMVEFVSLIPLGISAVTLGFGYLLAFDLFDLRRAVWLIPVAHAVIGLPFVMASVVPAMRSVDDSFRQAAATLGASPSRIWRLVDWPLVRPSIVTGAGFAAAVSLGEFGATSFLSRSEAGFTAPLAVFRLLGRPGSTLRGQALALSVVIGVVVALLAALLEWRRGEEASLL